MYSNILHKICALDFSHSTVVMVRKLEIKEQRDGGIMEQRVKNVSSKSTQAFKSKGVLVLRTMNSNAMWCRTGCCKCAVFGSS